MKPPHESCFRFKNKFSVWLAMILWHGLLSSHKTEWHGVGCWLRGLECVIDAWLGSSFGLRICQLGRLGNLLWQFFKKGRIRPRSDCFYILTTRISDRVLSNKRSGPRQNEGLCSKKKTTAYLQESLVKVIYLLGIHSKVPAKRNMNYKFQSGRHRAQTCRIRQQMVLYRSSH